MSPDHHNSCDCRPKRRALVAALLLLLAFALTEFGVGLYSHSVALRIEAGHMLSDAIALGIALGATWATTWFKSRRIEPLTAAVNSALLLGIAGLLAWESVVHLAGTPEAILTGPMVMAALGGVGINGVNATLLHQHSHQDLNVRSAFLHMLADVASALGVLVAALVIWQTGWYRADGIIGIGIALLIAVATVPLLARSLSRLFDPSLSAVGPPAVDPPAVDPPVSLSVPPKLTLLEQSKSQN
ncbi:MAG: cation diffusion facilitator family transporter [Elainellaceae cyanobacterium]